MELNPSSFNSNFGGSTPTIETAIPASKPLGSELNSSSSSFQPTSLNLQANQQAPSVSQPILDAKQPVKLTTPNPPGEQPKSGFDTGEYQIVRYNDLEYKIELWLDNSGNFEINTKNQFFINPQSVINMDLTDTLNDWVVGGSLVFMYIPENADVSGQLKNTGQAQKTQIKGAIENGKTLDSYEFRGDGYDMLRLSLKPVASNPQTAKDSNGIVIKENEPKWTLSYLFSITEVEDLSQSSQIKGPISSYIKLLRLKFHDVRYQILKTTNLEYSTAQSPEKEIDQNLANGSLGVLPTGKALLEVLNKALADSEQIAKGNTSLEFYQLPGDKDWDEGLESKIFYTSPAEYSALDDIDYIYAHHIGPKITGTEVNDFCVMHSKRSTIPGGLDKICLTPLEKIFKEATTQDKGSAGSLQLEHFFVTTHTKEEEDVDPSRGQYKAPNPTTNQNVLKTFKYGQIVSYSFVDMSPTVNSNSFTTTPVYSVDIGKRQFNIQFKNNDVASARKVISNGYINNLFKGSDGNLEDLFLPVIHKSKKDRCVFPAFSLNGDNEKVRQRNGIHQLMYTGLFQNACICFKTLGLTLREPGTFIGIDKTLGCVDSDYNNKLYGQYLVVRVDHVFEQGAYLNTIWAIKIHRFKKRETTFNNTE